MAEAPGLQPSERDRTRNRGLRDRSADRAPDRHAPRLRRGDGSERHGAAARLRPRGGRLARRPRLPQLPVRAHCRTSVRAARRFDRGDRPLLQDDDGPQGRRAPVPGRDQCVLLHRRPQRDADPHRASTAELARVPARSVPDDRDDSRNDDDHDDVVGDRRAVRQLLRAAHDRREGHGVPARRVADVLAHSHSRSHHALVCIRRWHLDWMDRLSVARRRGADGHGRVHRRVRVDRDLDDPRRHQHDRDDREHARARPELGQASDLRLERPRHRRV